MTRQRLLRGLLGASLSASLLRRAVWADDPPADKPLFLDSLFALPSTLKEGDTPLKAGRAQMEARLYLHAISAEVVSHRRASARIAAVTFPLSGEYARFQATVGRDDIEHVLGPAFCYFEVWGDGERLWQSDAIRSSKTVVVASTSSIRPKRDRPQEVDIPLTGVRTLRLLVRYADDFGQRGERINRATGCVWGDARLLPLPGQAGPLAEREAPFRLTLRQAVRELRKQVPALPDGIPPRLAPLPLRFDPGVPGDPGDWSEDASVFLAEPAQGAPATTLVPSAERAALARKLPADSPQRREADALADAGRQAGADFVVAIDFVKKETYWRIEARLYETASGALVAVVRQRVP